MIGCKRCKIGKRDEIALDLTIENDTRDIFAPGICQGCRHVACCGLLPEKSKTAKTSRNRQKKSALNELNSMRAQKITYQRKKMSATAFGLCQLPAYEFASEHGAGMTALVKMEMLIRRSDCREAYVDALEQAETPDICPADEARNPKYLTVVISS
jgi:hypothetical protein